MSDVSSIANATTSITALSNLIVVSPQTFFGYQPQNIPTQDGQTNQALPSPILFHYEGEQSATLESDITDHFVEDNTAIQDQIALKPVMITTQGFIGELNDVAPITNPLLKAAKDKLIAISGYQPQLTETALIAYNEAFFAYQLASNLAQSAIQSASFINGLGGQTGAEAVINGNGITNPNLSGNATSSLLNSANQTKQQIVFQQFYGYWSTRRLFTIQTPWAIFQDMAIKSLRAIQDAETRMISDFEVTFKQMRFASTDAQLQVNNNNFSTRLANQAAPETNNGRVTTTSVSLTPAQMAAGVTG